MRPERKIGMISAAPSARAKTVGNRSTRVCTRSICCKVARITPDDAAWTWCSSLFWCSSVCPIVLFLRYFNCKVPKLRGVGGENKGGETDKYGNGEDRCTHHGINALQNCPPTRPLANLARSVCPIGISLIWD